MQAITVTKHHHACVFVQDDKTRILVDPGQLGPQATLDGVDAVLITHSHFDHFDPDLIHAALDRGMDVWAPGDTIAGIGQHEMLHEAISGSSFTVGDLLVEVAGSEHAEVHPTIAGPQNRAYLIGHAVFITGDEHPVPPGPFIMLVTPIDAPWLRATDLIRYVQAVKPQQVVGIHDGLLNEKGLVVARHVAESLKREGVEQATLLDDGQTARVLRS